MLCGFLRRDEELTEANREANDCRKATAAFESLRLGELLDEDQLNASALAGSDGRVKDREVPEEAAEAAEELGDLIDSVRTRETTQRMDTDSLSHARQRTCLSLVQRVAGRVMG